MIAVVGSLNMDLVVHTQRLPKAGETVMGREFEQVPGGKGANQAAAIARLGVDVQMLGCIGTDAMGKLLKESLQKDGVDTEHIIETEKASTGVASILVEDSGSNLIAVAPGANYILSEKEVEERKRIIESADILLLQLETRMEVVESALELAKKAGKKTILNPAPAEKLSASILEKVDILTPNETELQTLTGRTADTPQQIAAAARVLIAGGVGKVLVTLGEKGCMYVTENEEEHFEAYRVRSIDSTAAGDSFNGAFAACLDCGSTIKEAITFAMKVGAMTVTKKGAQSSLPYKKEVEEFEKWLEREER